nr:metalloregulator ArsR/SmtB family transcription factor [uncultured Anaerosporobacter sp.]
MIYKRISNESIFFHSENIELIFAMVGVLNGDNKYPIYEQTYSKEFITYIKQKYCFLYSLHQQMKDFGGGLLEAIMQLEVQSESLDVIEEKVRALDKWLFIHYFFGGDGELTDFEKAYKEDTIVDLYNSSEHFTKYVPFLVFNIIFKQTEQVINDLFLCVREFNTVEFNEVMVKYREGFQTELAITEKGLLELPPLEYSEKLMGKTFYRRGPYRDFSFMPSVFTPHKVMRYMDKIQILFYSMIDTSFDVKDLTKVLKVISDETRFRIIMILSKEGPIIGKDLAARLHIATSTLSHHMEQLYSIGLVNEERVKNSKYYSINTIMKESIMNKLMEVLKTE